MSDLAVFVSTFESMAKENGVVTWCEDDLMRALGYTTHATFRKVVLRAMQACLSLNMDPAGDFIRVGDRYKLTRVACYLVAMNADPRKPQVAMVQMYLGQFASMVHDRREQAELVDRVVVREEIKEGMKALAATAKSHGVRDYALFMNAGYRGMYNMSLKEIEVYKGVPAGEALIDRMGRTELAANLFRVSLTDDKIKVEDVRGQRALETTAFSVGRIVRDAVIRAGGSQPEELPLAEHIDTAKKTLKAAGKTLKQLGPHEVKTELKYLAETSEDPEYTRDPEEEEEEEEFSPDSDPWCDG